MPFEEDHIVQKTPLQTFASANLVNMVDQTGFFGIQGEKLLKISCGVLSFAKSAALFAASLTE